MAIGDLDDRNEMLAPVIVLLVGVTVLGSFVAHADEVAVRDLSLVAAIVVAAFSLVIQVGKQSNRGRDHAERQSRNGGGATTPAAE